MTDVRTPRPTIGLSRVAACLPGLEPVEDILVRAGRPPMERKLFAKVHGLRTSPTLAPGEHTEDLLVSAGRAALGGDTADLVLYGHTVQTQELALRGGFPGRLRDRLGLPEAGCYGISHVNCTSVLRGIDLATRYLRRKSGTPADRVLVLGGDHGSAHDLTRVTPGMTVGGDAVAAVVVGVDTPSRPVRYRLLGAASGRETRFHRNQRMSPEDASDYTAVCATAVVDTCHRAAASAGLGVQSLDWVLPHLSNRMFWGRFAKLAGIDRERILVDLIPEIGHNFGVDALLALDHADRAGRLRPGDRCALISLGQGAYFQVLIIEVAEDS